MGIFAATQNLITLALYIGALGLGAFALIDALRYDKAVYDAVGRQQKIFWLAVLGVGLAVTFVVGPLNFLGIIGVAASLVYLVGIRPELQRYKGVGRGDDRKQMGPYGPW